MDEPGILAAAETLAAAWVARAMKDQGAVEAPDDDAQAAYSAGLVAGRDDQLKNCAADLRNLIGLLTP